MAVNVHYIEVPEADFKVVVPLFLGTTPWTWEDSSGDALLTIWAPGSGEQGVGGYSIAAINSTGAHELTVPLTGLPGSLDRFTLWLTSPTNKFDAQQVNVKFVDNDKDKIYADIMAKLGTDTDTIDGKIDDTITSLLQVLTLTEYNQERTINWDSNGTYVESIDIAMVADDAAPDFSNPDKRMRIEYTRDGNNKVTVV
ncbi:MAG: hypothetical protein ACWGQW_25690, partial [bacterium]